MALTYEIIDLPPVWPGKKTPPHARKKAPFKSQYTNTLKDLERELKHLGARQVQVALELNRGGLDLRLDGMLKADARPGAPIILSFLDREGHRQAYPCDTFGWWEDNLHAIAVVLEDLRRAERYGVQSGLIRAGFKALPSAGGSTITMSVPQAAYAVARISGHPDGSAQLLASPVAATQAIRAARAKAHPDAGGSNQDWTLLAEAKRLLDAHHGVTL